MGNTEGFRTLRPRNFHSKPPLRAERLLVVSGAFPYPPTNGTTMRIWMLLKALAANGHEVDLLSFGQQAQLETYSAEIRRVCRSAHVVPYAPASLSSGADYWCRLATLPSMMP